MQTVHDFTTLTTKYINLYQAMQKQPQSSQVTTLRLIMELTYEAVSLTKKLYPDKSGHEKHSIASEIVKNIYRQINPVIPGIPFFLKGSIDQIILEILLPNLINFIVAKEKLRWQLTYKP